MGFSHVARGPLVGSYLTVLLANALGGGRNLAYLSSRTVARDSPERVIARGIDSALLLPTEQRWQQLLEIAQFDLAHGRPVASLTSASS